MEEKLAKAIARIYDQETDLTKILDLGEPASNWRFVEPPVTFTLRFVLNGVVHHVMVRSIRILKWTIMISVFREDDPEDVASAAQYFVYTANKNGTIDKEISGVNIFSEEDILVYIMTLTNLLEN